MPQLITTSVVRGSHQGESHGGVYLIDIEGNEILKPVDWNTLDIDWSGRGWDRGLRGIAFHNGKSLSLPATCFSFSISNSISSTRLATNT